MNILVTGAAGFIGSRVSEFLLQRGHYVVGVDNINDAYDPRLKEWRLSQFVAEPRFIFHRLDIIDRQAMTEVFSQHRFDALINLAARAGVRPSLKDPWTYYSTNLTGTLNLLELCREHTIKKFVLASTSSVYGNGDRPFSESNPTEHPLSTYAASKKAAENLCYTYHHAYQLDISVLRYFTVYGPGGRPDMAIDRFIAGTAEETPLILYGDGSQERDFTYVDDIANGTILALQPMGFEVINLGSDRPIAIRRVLELVEQNVGKKPCIESRPAHRADVRATWADIRKAKNLLDWEPKMTLEEGLRQTVEWYCEHRQWAKDIRRRD